MSWSSQGDRTNFKLDYLTGKRQPQLALTSLPRLWQVSVTP
jgi:hypothetical protein